MPGDCADEVWVQSALLSPLLDNRDLMSARLQVLSRRARTAARRRCERIDASSSRRVSNAMADSGATTTSSRHAISKSYCHLVRVRGPALLALINGGICIVVLSALSVAPKENGLRIRAVRRSGFSLTKFLNAMMSESPR